MMKDLPAAVLLLLLLCGVIGTALWMGMASAAERSNTTGVPCTITHDWASTLTATCGAQQAFACSGARVKGAIAVGYDVADFVDGFTLNCHVSTTDEVTCEPCCAAGVACDPDSADYHLRVFNP